MIKKSSAYIEYQVILIFLLFSAFDFKALNSNKDCPSVKINQTPKKFGIQTMTFIRQQQTTRATQLISFLDHYANLQCTCFDTIYIVWNNKKSPQQLGIQMNQWKKKVVFTQTPYNSFGWKYVIPESAQEQFFLTVDDDILMTCKQLEQGFQQWKQHSFGQISPLLSYARRSMNYDEQGQIFKYTNGKNTNQYTISLMDCAFFSRQFADLYYSQYYQIRQIRKQVQLLNNCEDIAMNYVVSYFYPEILPRIYKNQDLTNNQFQPRQKFEVSDSPHFQKMELCLNLFSQIFTFNPLRFVSYKANNSKIQYDQTCIVLQKIQYYKNIVKRKTPDQIFQADKIFRLFESSESYYQQYWEKTYSQMIKKQLKQSDWTNYLKRKMEFLGSLYFWGVFSFGLSIFLINFLILKCFLFKYPRIKKNFFQQDEESLVLKQRK